MQARLLFVGNPVARARRVIAQLLNAYDVDVRTTVAGARDAIENGLVYECVLVDYDVDDGRGDDLVRLVRLPNQELPIVGISARAHGIARLLAAGANTVCAPSDFREVPGTIRSLLRKQRAPGEDAIAGVLLGCMVGDALGSVFEEAPYSERLVEEVEARARAPRHWKYTDDAEMALGVAESLLECDGVDPDQLAWCLARNMDISRGYGAGVRTVLESPGRWRQARHTYWEDGSKGNGAAVRVGPVACAYAGDLNEVKKAAWASAGVTHAHHEGRAGACIMAAAISTVLTARPEHVPGDLLDAVDASVMGCDAYDGKLRELRRLLARGADPEQIGTCLGTGILAVDSVPAALCVFLRFAGSFDRVVSAAVSLGGDADSIGAMVGALAGARYGASAIPTRWLVSRVRYSSHSRGPLHALATLLIGRLGPPNSLFSPRQRADVPPENWYEYQTQDTRSHRAHGPWMPVRKAARAGPLPLARASAHGDLTGWLPRTGESVWIAVRYPWCQPCARRVLACKSLFQASECAPESRTATRGGSHKRGGMT